jgi:sugar lactone lactonase YvrE
VLLLCAAPAASIAAAQELRGLNDVDKVASTVPANGDQNPYGVARVPITTGKLVEGNLLVSNFNNSANQQGTGSTIMEISPSGAIQVFAQIDANNLPGPCPGGVGLTTALVALRAGWVIVGSLPAADGTSATAKAGCLIVLDRNGQVVETISGGPIKGPWDMTAFDGDETAALFVTNVLNDLDPNAPKPQETATVVRLVLDVDDTDKPRVALSTVIGSGFPARFDPTALVIGPTGVALDAHSDILYVADSLNNRIAAISNPLTRTSSARTGSTLSQGGALNDPLGMVRAPNGDLIVANGGDGNLVEITPGGKQVAKRLVDKSGSPPGSGALFGLFAQEDRVFFVDDATNTFMVLEGNDED